MLTKWKINILTYDPHWFCLVLNQLKQGGWAVLLLLQELEQFRSSWEKKCRPHPATLNSVAWRRLRWTASFLSPASWSSTAVTAQWQPCDWLLVHPHLIPTGSGALGSPAAGTLGTLSAGIQVSPGQTHWPSSVAVVVWHWPNARHPQKPSLTLLCHSCAEERKKN